MTRALTNLKLLPPQSYISEAIFSRNSFTVSERITIQEKTDSKLITGKKSAIVLVHPLYLGAHVRRVYAYVCHEQLFFEEI